MAKLAFVGLGLMGTPMATRLLEAGYDLTVWNRTTQKTTPLADLGASVASTPAKAVAGVEAAITMVANPLALKDLRLVNQIADRAGRQLPLASASRAWLEQAAQSGAGDLDYSAVIAAITNGGQHHPA